jgi:hypothetical protein
MKSKIATIFGGKVENGEKFILDLTILTHPHHHPSCVSQIQFRVNH